MKKILMTLALVLGFTAAQAVGVSPRMLAPVWAASEAGIMPLDIPSVSLLDYFAGTIPEQGTVTSLYDDGELRIKFSSQVTINPAPTVYPKWLKDGEVVEDLDDPWGNDMEVPVSSATLSVAKLYPDSFTPSGSGTYSLVIPDGYLYVNGQPAAGITLVWTLEAGVSVETNSYSFKFADATDITGDDYSSGGIVGKNNPTFNLGGLKFDAHYVGSAPSNVAYKMLITTDGVAGTSTGFLRVPFQSASSTQEIVITAPEGVTLTEVAFQTAYQTAAASGTVTSETGSVNVSADQVVWKSTDPNGVNSFTTVWKGATRVKWEFGSVTVNCVGELGSAPEEAPSLGDYFDKTIPMHGNVTSLYEDSTLRIFFNALVTINPDSKNYMYWVHDGKVVKTLDDPYGNDVEELVKTETLSVIQVFESSFKPTESGDYQLFIPDGYLMVNGKPATGGDIGFTIETGVGGDDPVPAEFNLAGCINTELTFPQPGVDIDNEDGLSRIDITIANAPAGFSVNPSCTDRIYLNRDGVPVTSLSVSSDNEGNPQHYELTGNGDAESWSGKLVLSFAQMGIKDPGVYTVTIPEGFFKAGDATSTGYQFTYNILPPKEYVDAAYTVSPESGSTVGKLESLTLTFTDQASVELVENYVKHIALVFRAKNSALESGDIEDWDATVNGNVVTINIKNNELLDEDGTLTVTASNVFKFGEKYASQITITYNVKADGGDTPTPGAPDLAKLFLRSMPEQGTVDAIYGEDDYLRVVFNANSIELNQNGPFPTWKKNGEVVATLGYDWGNNWESLDLPGQSQLRIYQAGYDPQGAGTYELVIPDNFVSIDGVPATGMTLTWTIAGGTVEPTAPSLEKLFLRSMPEQGTLSNIFAEDDYLRVVFNANSLELNQNGPFPTWKKNGEVVATLGYDWGNNWESLDLPGQSQLRIYQAGYDPKDPGEYQLVIPDNFVSVDGVPATGVTLVWTVEGAVTPEAPSLEKLFLRSMPEQGTVDAIYSEDDYLRVVFNANSIELNQNGPFPTWKKNGEVVATLGYDWGNNWESLDLPGQSQLRIYQAGYDPKGAGEYQLVIPDNFVTVDGVAATGMTLTWTVAGGAAEAPSLEKLFLRSMPEQGTLSNIFAEDDYLRVVFNANSLELNQNGPFPTWKKNGEVVATLGYDWGNNWESLDLPGQSQLRIYQAGYDPKDPGEYQLVIPDNFVSVDGVPATGMTLVWTVEGAVTPEAPSLEKLFLRSMPEQGTVEGSFYEEELLRLVFNANSIELSQTAPYPVWKKDGVEVATVEYDWGNNYETLDLPGQSQIRLWEAGYKPAGPGVYELVIPDGWATLDGQPATGATFKWTIAGGAVEKTPVDMLDKLWETYPENGSTVQQIQDMMIQFSLTEAMAVNTECTEAITLSLSNDTLVSLFTADNEAAKDSKEPYYNFLPGEANEGGFYVPTLNLSWAKEALTAPGKYTVRIPKGFFLVGDNGINNALSLTYTVSEPAANVIPFENCIDSEETFPTPGTEVEGLESVRMFFGQVGDLAVNDACKAKITLTVNNEKVAEVGVADNDDMKTPYYSFMAFDGMGALGVTFAKEAITTPGTYKVNIPEGFFKLGNDVLGAYEMTYTVVGDVPAPKEYTLVTTFTGAGEYYLEANGKVMSTSFNSMDGYYSPADATIANGVLTADESNLLTIEGGNGGYYIRNSKGKYMGVSGFFPGMMNDSDKDGGLWSISVDANGKATIKSMDKADCYLAFSQGTFHDVYDLKGVTLPSLYAVQAKEISFVLTPEAGSTIDNFESFKVTALNSETIKVGNLDMGALFSTGEWSMHEFTASVEGNVATLTPTAPIEGNVTLHCVLDPGLFTADGGATSERMEFDYTLRVPATSAQLEISSYTPAPGLVAEGTDLQSVSVKPNGYKEKLTLNEKRTANPYIMNGEEVIGECTDIDMNQYNLTYVLKFKFGEEPITAPGTYKVVIPFGVFNLSGLPNEELAWEYIVPTPAASLENSLVSIEPEQGVVNTMVYPTGVGEITVVYNGKVTVNPDCAAKFRITSSEGASYEIDDEDMDVETVYIGADNQTTVKLFFNNGRITDNGEYTVTIPDQKLMINGNAVKGITYNYVIANASDLWSAVPESGSTVDSLTEITFTFPDFESIVPVDNLMDFVVMTYAGVSVANNWTAEVKGNTVTFKPDFGYAPVGSGEFRCVLEGCFTTGDGLVVPKVTYVINVKDAVATTCALETFYTGSTPNTGLVSSAEYPDGLKTFELTFNGKVGLVEGATAPIQLVLRNDDDSLVTLGEVAPSAVVINAGETSSTVTITFPLVSKNYNVHQLVIPSDVFTVNGLPSLGMKLIYNYFYDDTVTLASLVKSITPAEGVVSLEDTPNGLGVITMYTTEPLKPTTSNLWAYVEMYRETGETDADGNAVEDLVWQISSTFNVEYSAEDDSYTGQPYLRFYFGDDFEDSKQTVPGNYRIVIPNSDFLFVNRDQLIEKGMTLRYTLVEKVEVPKTELPKPAISIEGQVLSLDALNTVTLTLAEGEVAEIVEGYTVALYAAGSRADEPVCTYTLSANGNKVTATAVSPLTDLENGNYVLKISAGAIETANYVSGALDYDIVYAGKSGIAGVVAAPSYTVFTIDGKLVVLDGTLEQVKELSAGLYIVNGKKVLVRK